MNTNPFSRRYSEIDPSFTQAGQSTTDRAVKPTPFGGGDITAWINNINVANLEAVTWSQSVEVVGNYTIGNRDPLSFTKGKRVIVGSMSMQQWDKHALLEEVFRMSEVTRNQGLTMGNLWAAESAGSALIASGNSTYTIRGFNGSTTLGGASNKTIERPNTEDPTLALLNTSTVRGLSRSEYEAQASEQIKLTALERSRQLLEYSDQLPPFDMTLVGVSEENGTTAYCALFGIQITQETDGKSMNDLNPTVGFSFVVRKTIPWRNVINNAARVSF